MGLLLKSALTSALLAGTLAAPVEERASCPNIHVFGARETTAPAGYGSSNTFVNLILGAYSGSTAEAINYPAAGGTNAAYASSVQAGTQVIRTQGPLTGRYVAETYLNVGRCKPDQHLQRGVSKHETRPSGLFAGKSNR